MGSTQSAYLATATTPTNTTTTDAAVPVVIVKS